MTRNKLRIITVFLSILLLKCSYLDKELPVAAVENISLSKEELELGLNSSPRNQSSQEILQFLNDWVDQELLYQEAKRQNIVSSKYMEYELERLRKSMLVNTFLKERIDNIISVTESEVESYYESNKNEFIAESNYYKFEGIKTNDNSLSSGILRELNNKESIITIFDRNREKCEILSMGRNLIREDIIPGPVLSELRNRNPGQNFFNVVTGTETWFVKLIEKQNKDIPKSFESVRDEIYQKLLFNKRQEKYRELISRLRQNNKFEINLSVLVDSTSTR
ncbi:peptidyl-prolyl cis-trans isomerase [candidate division KSB1 bacterium]